MAMASPAGPCQPEANPSSAAAPPKRPPCSRSAPASARRWLPHVHSSSGFRRQPCARQSCDRLLLHDSRPRGEEFLPGGTLGWRCTSTSRLCLWSAWRSLLRGGVYLSAVPGVLTVQLSHTICTARGSESHVINKMPNCAVWASCPPCTHESMCPPRALHPSQHEDV